MSNDVQGLLIFLGLMSYSIISISSGLRLWSMRNGSQTRFVTWMAWLMFGISVHGMLGVYYMAAHRAFDSVSLVRECVLTIPAWVVAWNLSSIRRKNIKLTSQKMALIVEDNADQAKLLEELVREAGLASIVCASGEQAIALLAKGEYAVTFIDVRLSGKLNGLDLIQWIYESKISTHSVVVLTEAEDIKQHPNLPATIVLLKPMNLEKIKSVINRL